MELTHTKPDKQALQNRVRSARGHMGAIARMIDEGAPCADILHQLLAVRASMGAIERQLWRAYILDDGCGLRSEDPGQRAQAWDELQRMLVGKDA